MPRNLNKYLSDKLSATEILKIFGSIRTARTTPPEIRAGVIKAYDDTMYLMYLPALILCKCCSSEMSAGWADSILSRTGFIPFIAAFFTKNFFLGDTHNVVESKKVIPGSQDDLITPGDQETARTQAAVVDSQGPDVKRRVEGN